MAQPQSVVMKVYETMSLPIAGRYEPHSIEKDPSVRCLVLWADNASANLGVRVLASGTAELARQLFGTGASVEFQDFEAGESSVPFNGETFKQDVGRRRGPIKNRLEGIDFVLDTGAGDSFTDSYGWKRLTLMQHVRHSMQSLRIPYALTPQTIGPFRTSWGRHAARQTLLGSSFAVARDSVSQAAATSLGAKDVLLGTDVVFALPAEQPVPRSRSAVVNVSGLLWLTDRFGPGAEYQRLMKQVIRQILDRGGNVTALAHVLDNRTLDDDTKVFPDLEAEFGDDLEYLIPDSLAVARTVIASAEVVIASRMHACLNAISLGVPALPIAYSRKFGPLFRDLGLGDVESLASAIDNPDAVVSKAMTLMAGDRSQVAAAAQRGRSIAAQVSASGRVRLAGGA